MYYILIIILLVCYIISIINAKFADAVNLDDGKTNENITNMTYLFAFLLLAFGHHFLRII